MPVTTNKQRLLMQILATLGKNAKFAPHEERPVLEQFIYALCREGATREQADHAFRALRERFFDWNEIRVSSARELAEALDMLPEPEARGQRIIDFLQEVFETTYSFDLEILHKKGLKQAAKQLGRYQAANDYAVAWVTQQTLGGHAIPLDGPTLRCLRRMGIVESDNASDLEAIRAGIEHHIPKAKGSLFNDLLSALAEEFCWDDDPNCSRCPMCHHCPTGCETKSLATAGKHKPR